MTLRIGTRGSALAMAQTGEIARQITAATGVGDRARSRHDAR